MGWGVFHAKGWGSKSLCPPSKVCFPWVSREGTWDVPGICRDIPTCFRTSFFPFAPFPSHPSSSPFLSIISSFSPPKKRTVLRSVEQRAQRRAWRGAVPGWAFGKEIPSRNLHETRSVSDLWWYSKSSYKKVRARFSFLGTGLASPCFLRLGTEALGREWFSGKKKAHKYMALFKSLCGGFIFLLLGQ